MNDKHKWIILAAETTGKKYALDHLALIYKDIRDDDPRLTTPSAHALLVSLERPPAKDVSLICYTDREYPEKLKNLPEPPAQLYLRGSAEALTGNSVAVVGSRDASAYGLTVTADFCRDFCEAGLTVISGGARGVDSAAAKTMLKFGGKTVAVLGSGADVCYPAENAKLFDEIASSGGAVITEYHFGTQPLAALFPRRNRIIAALADACVVTEAGLRSGSLITANLAADLRRPLFAVPGNINSRGSTGANHLIKTGAILAENGLQVAAELKVLLSFKSESRSAHEKKAEPAGKPSLFTPLAPTPKNEEPRTAERAVVKNPPDGLTADEKAIIKAIENGASTPDAIAAAAGLNEASAAPALIMMELKGLIVREYNGYKTVGKCS